MSTQEETIEVLTRVWSKFPHLRLCQLIGNLRPGLDNYYVRNDLLIALLEKYEANHGRDS